MFMVIVRRPLLSLTPTVSRSKVVSHNISVNCFKHRYDAHCINLKFSTTGWPMWIGVQDQSTGQWLIQMMKKMLMITVEHVGPR